jgi:phosphate transport system protein
MSKHLQRDLDKLKLDIAHLGSLVEKAINSSIIALISRDSERAQEVVEKESVIDHNEVHIEEDCLKILALHQPVAIDLRFIVSVLKVNSDLERMGDFAVNIATRALELNQHDAIDLPSEFHDELPAHINKMVKLALEALVDLDVAKAQQVIAMDDFVDNVNKNMYVVLKQQIKNDISSLDRAVNFLSSSRYIERIADLTTNIAEDIFFMVTGEVVRHKE